MATSDSAVVVLVHSPLVGPGTWARVAKRLRKAGHDISVPDIHADRRPLLTDARLSTMAGTVTTTPNVRL